MDFDIPAEKSASWKLKLLPVIAVTGMCVFIFFNEPTQFSLFPPCMLHEMTGLHCPGCGGTRAMHALLHGRIAESFAKNPLLFVALPPLGLFWAGWIMGRPVSKRLSSFCDTHRNRISIGILIAVVAFTVLRNLPWAPFN